MAQGKPSGSGGSGRSTRGGSANRPAKKSAPGASRPPRGPSTSAATGRPAARRKKSKSIVNQKQTPWGLIATIAVVVVFAVVIVVVVVATRGGNSNSAAKQVIPSTPTAGATTVQKTAKRIANTTGISGVLAWDTGNWPGNGKDVPGALQHNHVTGPVQYSITPPVGGPHNATWMNAGVYTKPIPSERAVHNLEHGAVWITYDPNLSASKVAALRAFVGKQSLIKESAAAVGFSGESNRYMDMSPWTSNSLPSPIVMSSWGFQLRLTSPTDPRMQKFVDMFRNSSKYTPEFGSAVDGIPVSTGGRAAYDGATKPNPSS